jgi:hypothetical protein
VKRFWASWWSGRYADEGCTEHPFKIFVTGTRDRSDGRDEEACVLWLTAEDELHVRSIIMPHFPDYEERFVTLVPDDWTPNNRFPGIELYEAPPREGKAPVW